ncbi:MAG TPA: hypothetical protein PLV42_03220 [bacterium]|nr:hypothetical protein [bacterium]
MQRAVLFAAMFGMLFAVTACDTFSTEPGSFVVLFQWETGHEPDTAAKDYYMWAYYQEWKGGEGKTFPADIESNAKSLDEAGPVKLGSGESLNFTKLTYGDNRFVRAAIWDNADRTGDPLYVGVSELFDFSASDRNKTVAVNMKLQANAGVDETGQAGSFAIEVRYDGVAVDRVPSATVTLRLTVKNADTVIIANDLNFEKGVIEKKLTELTKIDETTYELAAWDITEGWTDLGDALYSVFGKSRNQLGYESVPKRAEVYLDTTAPFLTVKTDALAYNASGMVTITVSSNETLKESPLIGIYDADEALVKDISADVEELQAGTSYRYQIPVIGTLDDGDYHIVASAADLIDNATADIASDPFAVDSLAPELDGDPVITPGRIAAEQNYTVTFTAKEDMSGGLVAVQRKEETLTCTNTGLDYTCTGTSSAGEGDSIDPATITLTDAAGNIGSFNAGTLYIDRTSPTLTIDLNKTAFNAADTIRVTVTTSEELDDLPVTTIPKASMTLAAPTQISSFSWLYTVDPTLFADDDYTVNTEGDDLVAQNGADSADFSVDSSVPDLVTGTVDRAKAGIGIAYTVDFETTEPVIGTGGVPAVKANEIPLSCVKNGSDTIFRCARTVGAEETDSTVYGITATLTDAAGNNRIVTIGSVMADKVLPNTVSGTVVLSIDAGVDCALTQEQVTTIADGATAYLSVQVSEKLAVGYTPTLTATKTDAPDRVFDLDTQNGLTYYFSYLYSESAPTPDMIGEYTLELSLKDEAGNETMVTVTPDKPFKTAWNTPVLVIDQNAVSYNRSPWGRPTDTPLKDGLGATIYTLPADEYYELGPNDIYEATDRLPAGTFTLNYGTATGAPVQLKAWDKEGAELRMEHSRPNGDGTWSRGRVWAYNTPKVLVSAVDSSCHETVPVKIQNANWLATMNRKEPGDYYKNPHTFLSNGLINQILEQDLKSLQEPLNGGISLIQQQGKSSWVPWDENDDQPAARHDHAMTYDSTRGKVVLFGGSSGGSETWEWDGANWTQKNPATRPPTRSGHAVAYDSARGKVVLFGGDNGTVSNNETWEWDGTNWTQMNPVTKPSVRSAHAMAYDSVRGKVVLFGGYLSNNQTWEWDGTNWTLMNPATRPSARYGHAMAYDSARRKVVLFGGNQGSSETWEWDGTNWTQMNPVTKPSGRSYHEMAYDSVHGKVFLFGGLIGASTYNNETWEWNGTNWIQMTPGAKPSTRYNHAMAYDSARGKTVIFGGYTSSAANDETWEWDGTNWTRMNLATRPSGRIYHAMTYDSTRKKAVLFGGSNGVAGTGSETWEWDGANWTQMNPAAKPTTRYSHAMAYDSTRGKVLLFGGTNGGNETWEWDGANWTQMSPVAKPSTRYGHAMAYDSVRGKVVLFGGTNGTVRNDETWEWDGTNWTQMSPVAKPSTRYAHAMAYDSLRGKVVLFGGHIGSGQSDETWEWNGTNWTQMNPTAKPSTREYPSMTYDSAHGKVILFGGLAVTAGNDETWEWDGTNWIQMNLATKPSGRYGYAMTYDSFRAKVVLFGGDTSSGYNNETWLWDGNNNDRAGQIMNVSWESSGITDDNSIQSVSVFFNAGGLGDITGTPTSGVDLLAWKHARWETVASNEADPENLAPVTWETTDPVEIQTLLNSGLRKFNFAVVPTAPNGFLTDMGSIATDYAEVIVRYSAP